MSVYDLPTVKLPVLTGAGLKLFAAALGNSFTRSMLASKLISDAGIPRLRELDLADAPTYLPLVQAEGPGARPEFAALGAAVLARTTTNPAPSVRDYARAYRDGTTTPDEVAKRYFAAVVASDDGDRPLRAMLAVDKDDVTRQAAASTARLKAGKPLSIFDGVPVAIKDELDQVPYPTTVGTKFLGKRPVTADSTLVERLRAAGALLIGKANMHEIGINPNGHNLHYGTVRNPYDKGHDPGGSSSGSAAAVAAGLCPVAIGADGGGSIRVPAGLCGIVGLKGTFGRFSEHGVAPLCWSVGHVGPLTATVEDMVLTYAVTGGADPHDELLAQPDVTVDGWDAGNLDGVRLGVFRPWFEHADGEIVQTCDALLEKLEGAGAKLVDVEIPDLNAMRIAHAVTILTEMATSMGDHAEHFAEFAPSVKVSLAVGGLFSSRDYVQAQRVRTGALATFDRLFNDVDVILTPATGGLAPAIREDAVKGGWSDLTSTTEIMRFMVPGNLAGLPGLSFPAGYAANGLPIGMQAYGRHWNEALLLRVAAVAEGLVERRRPSTFYDLLNG